MVLVRRSDNENDQVPWRLACIRAQSTLSTLEQSHNVVQEDDRGMTGPSDGYNVIKHLYESKHPKKGRQVVSIEGRLPSFTAAGAM